MPSEKDQPQAQEVETTEVVAGKVKFGFAQIKEATPKFAIWIFRTEFVFNKVILFWLGGQDYINGPSLKMAIINIASIDLGVWLFAKFFGVTKENIDQ